MHTMRAIFAEERTAIGRRFNLLVSILILVSLVSFTIETLPGLDHRTHAILTIIDAITVAFFTFEYIGRLLYSRRTWHYALSFYGIVDLLAILPFYLASGVDLRSVRAVRLLRVVRVLKLARYSRALNRLTIAVRLIHEELILFAGISVVLIYIAAVGIYYFEHAAQPAHFSSILHSLWWAVITLTTVGYGDVYPVTVGGRLFTFGILLVGIGVIALPSGLFASALSRAREISLDHPEASPTEINAVIADELDPEIRQAVVERDRAQT